MSNDIEDNIDPIRDAFVEEIKVDSPKTQSPFVKPTIHVDSPPTTFTVEQQIAIAKMIEDRDRERIKNTRYNSTAPVQILPKEAVVVTDFSKMSIDEVYDLSIPIEAKPFFSADVLGIVLKDTNYEARWVNKNPQNLGQKMAKGYTYITETDIVNGDHIQTAKDSAGHFSFDDVVAMKIDKATYYSALRAAHIRAMATTNETLSRKRAATSANNYMRQSDTGYNPNDFASATATRKMNFYDPDITI